MERDILQALEFQIVVPTSHDFLSKYLAGSNADERTRQLSFYILDSTLLSYDLTIEYLPSQLAAAAFLIAERTVSQHSWRPCSGFQVVEQYNEAEIAPIARAVLAARNAPLPQKCGHLEQKYSLPSYGTVSGTTLFSDF